MWLLLLKRHNFYIFKGLCWIKVKIRFPQKWSFMTQQKYTETSKSPAVPTKFSFTHSLSFYVSIIFSYSFFIGPFFLCSEIQWSQKNVIFHLYLKSILLLIPLSLFYLHLKYCPAPVTPCTVLHLIPSHFASEMGITMGIPLPWVCNSLQD